MARLDVADDDARPTQKDYYIPYTLMVMGMHGRVGELRLVSARGNDSVAIRSAPHSRPSWRHDLGQRRARAPAGGGQDFRGRYG